MLTSKLNIIREQTEKLSPLFQQSNTIVPDLIRKQAEKIMTGTIFFYQTQEVRIGIKNIDWSGTHLKHQEWPAQLNRFYYLIPLVTMYQQTKDEKYAQAARAYIEDWLKYRGAAERKTLHRNDNTLNLSIRLGNSCFPGWGDSLAVFIDSPIFISEFVEQILASIERQADFLSHNLVLGGNQRISQLDTLVITALRFPFFENAKTFLQIGLQGIEKEFKSQMLPDGVHEERSPGYHVWMTKVMVRYCQLKKIFSEKVKLYIDRDTLKKTIEFSLLFTDTGINDSLINVFSKKNSNIEKHKDLMQNAGFDIEGDWLPVQNAVYPKGGFVFFNTDKEVLVFDAGGSSAGGHTHLSRLALTYRVAGQLLVADPGILNYETSDPFMAYGKSTPAHSTINLNGMNQIDVDASLINNFADDNFFLAHGHYEGGYWPGKFLWSFTEGRGNGRFGRHDRIIFGVRDEYILVFDRMQTEPDLNLVINNCWQLAPMDNWKMNEEHLSWWSKNSDINLYLQMIFAPKGAKLSCYEGQTEPEIRGWVGKDGKNHVAAPLAEFSYTATSNDISAVLLRSFNKGNVPEYKVTNSSASQSENRPYLELSTPEQHIDYFSWSPALKSSIDDSIFSTDAQLAWVRKNQAGKVIKAFVFNATYLEFDSVSLCNYSSPFSGTVNV